MTKYHVVTVINTLYRRCISRKMQIIWYIRGQEQHKSRYRGVNSFLKLGGQVAMRRAASARRRLLFCQNLGEYCPPAPLPLLTPLYYHKVYV